MKFRWVLQLNSSKMRAKRLEVLLFHEWSLQTLFPRVFSWSFPGHNPQLDQGPTLEWCPWLWLMSVQKRVASGEKISTPPMDTEAQKIPGQTAVELLREFQRTEGSLLAFQVKNSLPELTQRMTNEDKFVKKFGPCTNALSTQTCPSSRIRIIDWQW